jgi:hypothetical protein
MTNDSRQVRTLNSSVDKGGLRLAGLKLGPLSAEGSFLSIDPLNRSVFENCEFSSVKAKKCVVGFPVFRHCVFRNIESDFLRCYGAIFLECKLEGRIRRVSFGVCPELEAIDDAKKKRVSQEASKLLGTSKHCLDVRDAILSDVGFYGEDIARRVIFNKGQCALLKGEGMPEKLEVLAKKTKDRALQMALFTLIAPGTSLHLVSMETCGTTERIEELRKILSEVRVELIDEPIV